MKIGELLGSFKAAGTDKTAKDAAAVTADALSLSLQSQTAIALKQLGRVVDASGVPILIYESADGVTVAVSPAAGLDADVPVAPPVVKA